MDRIKTLNKDLKLKQIDSGIYDRMYANGDFKLVEGHESLKNGVIITIMTRLGELAPNPTYKNFGCWAWSQIKSRSCL